MNESYSKEKCANYYVPMFSTMFKSIAKKIYWVPPNSKITLKKKKAINKKYRNVNVPKIFKRNFWLASECFKEQDNLWKTQPTNSDTGMLMNTKYPKEMHWLSCRVLENSKIVKKSYL